MAWDESKAWNQGALNEKFYQALLDEATEAPQRNARIATWRSPTPITGRR